MNRILCLFLSLLLIGSVALADYRPDGDDEIRATFAKMTDEQLIYVRGVVDDILNERSGGDKASSSEEAASQFVPWNTYGLAQRIPDPSAYLEKDFKKVGSQDNEKFVFRDSVEGFTSEDFRAYTDLLVSVGFNLEVYKIGDSFMGKSEDGVTVTLYLDDDVMTIEAIDMSVFG